MFAVDHSSMMVRSASASARAALSRGIVVNICLASAPSMLGEHLVEFAYAFYTRTCMCGVAKCALAASMLLGCRPTLAKLDHFSSSSTKLAPSSTEFGPNDASGHAARNDSCSLLSDVVRCCQMCPETFRDFRSCSNLVRICSQGRRPNLTALGRQARFGPLLAQPWPCSEVLGRN